ncbi:MAG: hypothetical protein AAF641_03230 [Pseudomonadota bacterium]
MRYSGFFSKLIMAVSATLVSAVIVSADPDVGKPDLTPVDHSLSERLLPGDQGEWRKFVQLLWVVEEDRLVRLPLRVHDPFAAQNFDLSWEPDGPIDLSAYEGGDWGTGRLIWRRPDARPYDRTAVLASFSGRIVDGFFTGEGRFQNQSGMEYQGGWSKGLMHGRGVLHHPNGDRFEGIFAQGLAEGPGRLRSVFGEVFEGQFLKGLRHGAGRVIFNDGRAYRSYWEQDVEDLAQRVWDDPPQGYEAELVQSANQTSLRFGIAVDRTVPDDGIKGIYKPYIGRFEDAALRVFPDHPNFKNQQSTSSVLVARQHSLFGVMEAFLPANFTMSLENTDPWPVQIVGGFLQVSTSVPDLTPFIYADRDLQCGQRTLTKLYLRNFGTTQPFDARMTGGPVAAGEGRFLAIVDAGTVEGWPRAEVEFAEILPQMGPEIAALGQIDLPCPGSNYPSCLQSAKAVGRFGILTDGVYLESNNIMVDYLGDLSYQWKNHLGQRVLKTKKIRFPWQIGKFASPNECGEGSDSPRVFPNPFVLQVDRQNYQVRFPFQTTLAPGQLSTWNFQVDADASSKHVFKMVLELADGRRVESQLIDLTYFKPRDIWSIQ